LRTATVLLLLLLWLWLFLFLLLLLLPATVMAPVTAAVCVITVIKVLFNLMVISLSWPVWRWPMHHCATGSTTATTTALLTALHKVYTTSAAAITTAVTTAATIVRVIWVVVWLLLLLPLLLLLLLILLLRHYTIAHTVIIVTTGSCISITISHELQWLYSFASSSSECC
jgi:hypothetical protein